MGIMDKLSRLFTGAFKHTSAPQSSFDSNAPFDSDKYLAANQEYTDAFCRTFDLTSIEGIRSIDAAQLDEWKKNAPGVPSTPVQILSKQASSYHSSKQMDLAIECLRKVNELYDYDKFPYRQNDYLRLVRYLRDAKRFDEAREEEAKIQARFGHKDETLPKDSFYINYMEDLIRTANDLNTDLVQASTAPNCCELCGKYRGRIFSLTGRDKRFPKLPDDFHLTCGLGLYAFVYGASTPLYVKGDLLTESKKPFVDSRTPEEREAYAQRQQQKTIDATDRDDYAWLQEFLPDLAPKSFGGYRRMKNLDSNNYKTLKVRAAEMGHPIGGEQAET